MKFNCSLKWWLIVGSIVMSLTISTQCFAEVKSDFKTSNSSPLINLEQVVVNKEGTIFCGVQFFSKIQAYDSKGNYLYSLDLKEAGGKFKLKIDDKDNLHVVTARGEMHYIFDSQGRTIKAAVEPDAYYQFEDTNAFDFIDKKHNVTYEIQNPFFLYPHIVKVISSQNKEETIISDSLTSLIIYRYIPLGAIVFVLSLPFWARKYIKLN